MESLSTFAGRVQTQILKQRGMTHRGNCVVSPYSIFLVTLMLMRGARGPTKNELMMLVPEGDYRELRYLIETPSGAVDNLGDTSLVTSSLLYVDQHLQGTEACDMYLDSISQELGATCIVQALDFSDPEQAARQINEMVSARTKGHIANIVPANQLKTNIKVLGVSAAFFSGKWNTPFHPNLTELDIFYRPSINTSSEAGAANSVRLEPIEVPMMKTFLKKAPLFIFQEDSVTGVGIGYTDPSYIMFLLQPDDPNDLFPLSVLRQDRPALGCTRDSLPDSEEVIKRMIQQAPKQAKTHLTLTIPTFSLGAKDNRVNLIDVFKGFGVNLPFQTGADFSGISDLYPLVVSMFVHQADISVDEKGTVAAAAAAVGIESRMASQYDRYMDLKFDKPFYFQVRKVKIKGFGDAVQDAHAEDFSESSLILFSGQITDPSTAQAAKPSELKNFS